MFIGLVSFSRSLISIANADNHTKCISLNKQQCMTQPTIFNLNHDEYIKILHYYPFAVNLDRCTGSFSALNDLLNRICVPNKTEGVNLSVFNMIMGINE